MNCEPLFPVYRTVTGPKTPKSLESGYFTKLSLLPISINFQLLIPVLGSKGEQLNRHLGKHPLASLQTHVCPFMVPSPLAWALRVVPAGRGWGSVRLAFLCCSSFPTPWLPSLAVAPSGAATSSVPTPVASLPPNRFFAWSVAWWWCSVCVTVLFLLLDFFFKQFL